MENSELLAVEILKLKTAFENLNLEVKEHTKHLLNLYRILEEQGFITKE